ncbi:MAG: pentapeptide repeat-containing protein [Okeania sp. SIO3B5]|uniref:pentapeptide repeat-containing protein n=1 Tax=Okeania sp. SIO3B5 TaxID=2607811 RepID=UPI0014011EB7|nr:pentapeptide repeat-containing protein [Okeania sp. SIO3B5]NEO52680.1 pentapeptide repeat-containing protein [Okeania sp. SIO3B5]
MANKSPKNLEDKSNQEVTKIVPMQQQKQNFLENLITKFYNLFGIQTLYNEEFHSELNRGRKDFRRTRLIKPDLVGLNLDGINLSGVNLNRANLSGASLQKAQLHKTKMVGANLDSTNLKGANLSRANLGDAQLSWADLRNINLSNTILNNANLTGADLDQSQSILDAEKWFTKFEHTRLPEGVFLVWYIQIFAFRLHLMKKREKK